MREDKDIIEFMPDALAVKNMPLPRWARNGIPWFAVVILIILIWAYFGHVDVIVIAKGKLVSDHPTIVMRPMERTVIKDVCVRVGDRVSKGQTLVLFDPVLGTADEERLAAEIRTLEAQFARLNAEFRGEEYLLPSNPTTEQLWQFSQYTSRKSYHTERVKSFIKSIAGIEINRKKTKSRLLVEIERLKRAKEIENMFSRAFKSRAVTKKELKEQESLRLQLEADVSDDKHQLVVLDAERDTKIAEQNVFLADWSANVAAELAKTKDNLISTHKAHDKAVRMAMYTRLEAPEDAMVINVVPLGVGAGINEAEDIVTLAPLGGTLEAEAEVRARDVGYIRVGDDVRVKITTFPFQQHGTVLGKVRVISEDSFTRKDEGAESEPYFRVRIELTKPEIEGSDLMRRLIPGMAVQNEVSVEKRRILRYLTDPIVKSLSEAIREP